MAIPGRSTRLADPIISWPCIAGSLQKAIGDMQRLNPGLGLRRAISTWEPDYAKLPPTMAAVMRRDLDESRPSEFLIYDGTSLDVLTIAMPDPPSDEIMSALTEVNREGGTHKTDLGNFRFGPRRVERSADGSLFIRPRSPAVEDANGRFAMSYHDLWRYPGERQPIDQIIRFQSRWGIFRDRHELWEVDFAYHVPDYLEKSTDDEGYWRTTPIGTISHIDCYDLPIDEHYRRAKAIIAAGSQFAIVVNLDIAEAVVFRNSGDERFTSDFGIPEWPWFDVPVRVAG